MLFRRHSVPGIVVYYILTTNCKGGSITMPILQMRKLRFGGVMYFPKVSEKVSSRACTLSLDTVLPPCVLLCASLSYYWTGHVIFLQSGSNITGDLEDTKKNPPK